MYHRKILLTPSQFFQGNSLNRKICVLIFDYMSIGGIIEKSCLLLTIPWFRFLKKKFDNDLSFLNKVIHLQTFMSYYSLNEHCKTFRKYFPQWLNFLIWFHLETIEKVSFRKSTFKSQTSKQQNFFIVCIHYMSTTKRFKMLLNKISHPFSINPFVDYSIRKKYHKVSIFEYM